MKIQIDTEKKVLRLESDVNLGEFMTKIRVLFPKGEWKDFKLETNVKVEWRNPIYVDRWHYPTYPWWPNRQPIRYYSGGDTINGTASDVNGDVLSASYNGMTVDLNGVYNVEV